MLGPKTFCVQKFRMQKKFWVRKKCGVWKILGPKNFWVINLILNYKLLCPVHLNIAKSPGAVYVFNFSLLVFFSKFWVEKNLWSEKKIWGKNFESEKMLNPKKNFGSKNIWVPKKFVVQKRWVRKKIWFEKNFWYEKIEGVKKYLVSEKILGPKNVWVPKNFRSGNFFLVNTVKIKLCEQKKFMSKKKL